jgi:hypothetical protein
MGVSCNDRLTGFFFNPRSEKEWGGANRATEGGAVANEGPLTSLFEIDRRENLSRKLLECQHCGQLLYSRTPDASVANMSWAICPTGRCSARWRRSTGQRWRALIAPEQLQRFCADAAHGACNWLVPAPGTRSASLPPQPHGPRPRPAGSSFVLAAPGRRQVSPVAWSRRTAMLVLPPCSRSGSKTALQPAHRPSRGTLENPVLSRNP